MNYSIIFHIIGWILNLEGAFMLLPCITALIYREMSGWAFALTSLLCFAVGLPLMLHKPKTQVFYLREGFVTTSLSWITLSIMGAVPFVISGCIPNPVDALFESVSGFTTTGASILTDVEALPHCMLLWRSFTHWIGGMGVLVFLLVILPMSGGSQMHLMKAESTGPAVNRILPKVKSTAMILYAIYLAMTLLQIILMLLGGCPVFDTLAITFGTAGTGGFSVKNDGCAGYSTYLQIVITIFMILFGISFNVYYLMLSRKFKTALSGEEIRWYFCIIAAAILLIGFNTLEHFGNLGTALQQAAFQVGSIITTTGYATCDFNLWPQFSKTILVLLMFIGACAGSTGGGIKISRILILSKTIRKEMRQLLHPRSVKKIQLDGRTVEHEIVRSTNVFLIVYLFLFALSITIVTLDNYDLITSFTAVTAALNNIGPGLEQVGPMGNFSIFSDGVTLLLTFDMLAGRLELFPMILLFSRNTWKKF